MPHTSSSWAVVGPLMVLLSLSSMPARAEPRNTAPPGTWSASDPELDAERPPAANAEASSSDTEPVDTPPFGSPPALSPVPPFEPDSFWRGWKGSVEAGINGSSGNSENFNLRLGFAAERITTATESRLYGSYTWGTDRGEKTRSRAELNARNDWNFGGSPWFVFAIGRAEFDEFQDWRWRLSALVGPGYTLIKDEQTTLKLRSGIGLAKELGGEQDELTPELDFGVDFEHQLTERQKLFVTADYYPSIEDFADYHTNVKAGWQILVDPQSNLLLKIGIEHRHQSEPGAGFRKNDLDYFAVMGWQF